jgi:ATP-dependent RNA helicase RhlE
MATPEDEDMVKTLEKIIGEKLPRLTMEDFDYEVKPHANQTPRGTHSPKKENAGHHHNKNRPSKKKRRRRRPKKPE